MKKIFLAVFIILITSTVIIFVFYIRMYFPYGSKEEYKTKSEVLVSSLLKDPEHAVFAPMKDYDFIRKGNIGFIRGYVITDTKKEFIIEVNLKDKSLLSFIFDGEEYVDKTYEIIET